MTGRAELDHLDSFDRPAEEVPGTEDHAEEDMDNISEDKEEEETSDEEEVAEPAPIRRRLRCKTSAPEYGPPSRKVQLRLEEIVGRATPHGLPVMKRPGMLKRPAGRSPWPNECCAGYQGIACRFCPMEPGKPARVHPERGIRHCSFCKKEDMEATSQDAGRRGVLTRALKKFLAVDRGIFDMALQRVQLFLGEEAAKDYQKKAGGKPRPEAGWEEALEHRQLVGRPLTRKQRKSMMRPSVATSAQTLLPGEAHGTCKRGAGEPGEGHDGRTVWSCTQRGTQ